MGEGAQVALGVTWTLLTMGIAVLFIIVLLETVPRFLLIPSKAPQPVRDAMVLFFAVLWLLGGVFLVVTLWALLFVWRGEFSDLATAVYFSVVSVTTVGYGDITVSSHSRVLAGFAAADGFLIFGLDTAALYEALGQLKSSHQAASSEEVSIP
ncbi:MAG: ion channel [Pseudomonadota bacterium]